VRLLGDDEERRIRELGAALGVDTPVVDGRLRFADGRCVLRDATGCRVHAAFGSAAKPAICRQYPLVVVDTGDELRVGIDPGCYTAWRTRRHADPLSTDGAVAHPVALDPANARHEAAILGILGAPGITVAGALGILTGAGPGADLPPGFGDRWLDRVRGAELGALLDRPETGAAVRGALAPVVAALEGMTRPPAWGALAPDDDAWAVEVARRLVALRLCTTVPMVPAVALLALGGAIACAWADPAPERFGTALAGWSRAIRAPIFWQALLPGPEALRALVAG
jgi:hypothetical protein